MTWRRRLVMSPIVVKGGRICEPRIWQLDYFVKLRSSSYSPPPGSIVAALLWRI